MKKLLYASITFFALLSCAKNELIPLPDAPQEIKFQNVVNLATKGSVVPMDSNIRFRASAYYLPEGKKWIKDFRSSKRYFYDELIGYVDGEWKCVDKPLYWPKEGSLMIATWSDKTKDPFWRYNYCDSLGAQHFLTYTYTGYQYFPQKELIVALAIAPEKGMKVPLEFHPIFTKLTFSVCGTNMTKTQSDLSSHTALSDEHVEIVLNSIKLKSTLFRGDYHQRRFVGYLTSTDYEFYAIFQKETMDIPLYTNPSGLKVTSEVQNLTPMANDQYLMLPHTFIDIEELEVSYKYITRYHGYEIINEVTTSLPLTQIYGTEWGIGKHYHLNLTLAPDEITWEPTVIDWISDSGPLAF